MAEMPEEIKVRVRAEVERGGIVMVAIPAQAVGWANTVIELLQTENKFLREQIAMLQHKKTINSVNPFPSPEYTDALVNIQPFNAGGKIPTIKRIREMTGMGLKESKDLSDQWERDGHVRYV